MVSWRPEHWPASRLVQRRSSDGQRGHGPTNVALSPRAAEGVKPLVSPLSFENRCLWRRRDCSNGNPRRRALSRLMAGASHTGAGASHVRAGRQEAPTHTRKAQGSLLPPTMPPNALSVPSLAGVRGPRILITRRATTPRQLVYTHPAGKILSLKRTPSNAHTVGIGVRRWPATATYRAATKAAVKDYPL